MGLNGSKLIRETAMAIGRSLGLIGEGRDGIERSRGSLPAEILPIHCSRCWAQAPLIRRELMDAHSLQEIWTFECVRCSHLMQQFHRR
jgi:hypothetical protein